MSKLLEKANWITLMLCVGVIQVSIYYLLSATLRPDGLLAVIQPDSSLYFQAARRVAEGAPFTYCAGGAVNTGTTSVLHPFILAVPYALGFTGGSLVGAGFLLNSICYLVFIVCWALVIDAKVREPVAKVVSALLLALFGQFTVVALAQSDIGLWMALSSVFALGLATNRTWLWAAALVVSPWVRPEGMVCVIAALMVAFAVRRHRGVALLGLVSVLGVFVLNRHLTGAWQFTSIQSKGHFVTEPFFQAVMSCFRDALTMLRQLFLGLASGSREMFFFPILGAVCLWYHVFRRDYSDFDAREAIFLLASAGGFATVAMSGWQGTNLDRYLAWFLPVAVIWTACGAVELGSRLKGAAKFLPATLLLLFGVAGSVAEACWFRLAGEQTEMSREFYTRCESVLPAGATYGAFGNGGSAYWLSPRRFEHLYGIYSPHFKTKALVSAFEILKHEPGRRFDYWLYDDSIEGDIVAASSQAVFGETVLTGPIGLSLRKADWSPFDSWGRHSCRPAGDCKGCLDIGYEPDERDFDYQAFGSYSQRAPEPFFRLDTLYSDLTAPAGRQECRPHEAVAEVGRVVTGGDEMTIRKLTPGKPLTVVMRTVLAQKAERIGPAGGRMEEYSLSPSQTLRIFVDGDDAGSVGYTVAETGFSEVRFTIPASAIAADTIRLSLVGDHIACCYWFYQ